MARFSVIKEAILICREAMITPFIWGHHGLGKSSLVRQVAESNSWGFVDLRCSQIEASDIRGLPDRGHDGRTYYLPPGELPGNNSPPNGILFLDEVNRAHDDVLQAIFQLVLDRRIGEYTLPQGWCIVAAGNYSDNYHVSNFDDPAFLDRFCHLVLSSGETTLDEWIEYMTNNYGDDAAAVIKFTSHNIHHLDGDTTDNIGFTIKPSRRSWEMVVRAMRAARNGHYSDEAKQEVIAGLVGRDLAISFLHHHYPIKVAQLLVDGVNAHLATLNKLDRNQLVDLMHGLVSHCKRRLDDDKVAALCLDFAEFIINSHVKDRDVAVAFCFALIGENELERAALSNIELAKTICRYNAQHNLARGFIDRLSERPALRELIAKVSWGTDS